MAQSSRFEDARREREEFADELADKYLGGVKINSLTKQDIFDLAWEYGHASGKEEVDYYYGDLAILVKDALIRKGF